MTAGRRRPGMDPLAYLAIGHVAKDLAPDGWRLGGSVAYAALTAQALGWPAGLVTACAAELDPALAALTGLSVHRRLSPESTTFENCYGPAGRTQYLRSRAALLSAAEVPAEWRQPRIVHLAPLDDELDVDLLGAFPGARLGLTVQGWLRQWDAAGRVSYHTWPAADRVLPHVGAAILSVEDVRDDWNLLEHWAALTPILVVTQAAQGCTVFVRGAGRRQIPGQPQPEVDPTGAGDVFAAAFLIQLAETGDPWAAARLANAVAAQAVTRVGLAGVPTAAEVQQARQGGQPL